MLKMIYVNFDDVKNEINEFVDWDLGNHGNGNSSSSTRCVKFIEFSIKNRSGHSE